MRERYSFRFTNHEIAEMNRVLERHGSRPLQTELEDLALSFSKIRQEQGMTCVRVESIQSWFKRHRDGYTKTNIGRPRAKSAKSRRRTLSAQPSIFANEKNVAEDETSGRSSSDEGSIEGEMSESMDSEDENGPNIHYQDASNSVDCKDISLKPAVPQQGPITESDGVVARLPGYTGVQSEAGPKSIVSKCNDSSILFKIGQARETMDKLKGLSMVDYRKCEEDIKLAVKIFLEEGDGLLSETEKSELTLLPEKLLKVVQANDQVRKELADCRAFLEKVEECEENTVNLIKKATILEEKYNAFPQNILTVSNKGDDLELEAAVLHAKAEAEKIKGDKEDVAAQLVRIAQCLQSASTHYKILKAEEAAVGQKNNKLMESLRKNTEEWLYEELGDLVSLKGTFGAGVAGHFT